MERVYTRINWENEPSILTPLNATNLNKIDSAVYTIDGRVVGYDTTKANQSDLLQCVKQVDYNTTTGVFTFTWQNGTTKTVDLNIEKIPVSFSMDEHGVITMTTADGTTYTADVGALIKTYTFVDSDVIDFTVTTDESGNKTVTADIIDGTITGDKLQPNYLADCQQAKSDAESASASADTFSEEAEAWANGEIDGTPVPSTHPAYHNNAKYYKDMANPTQLSALTDVNINIPSNRQALVYDTASQKWVNGSGGLLPQMEITTEDGSTVTISKDGETITATSIGSGKYYAEIPEFGEWTVSASKGSQSATRVVNVDTVKIYDVNASYFTAYINVTAPNGSSVTVVNGSETYTKATAPYNFEVHSAGTWVVTATKTDASKSKNVVISSDGQTVTTSIAFASITVTYPDEMEFETITATDGTRTYTRVASGTVVFDIANYGEWVVSCMGVSVTVNVTADIDYPIELKSGFDVQEWLQAGSVSGTYASLAEVLADEKALRQLFTKHASVDYLVECCTSDLDESVGTIINTDLCAKWINLRDYALDALYANTYIASAMDTADKYFYGEWVLVGQVPTMTSNTAPYGVASASSAVSGNEAYKAFDGKDSTDYSYWSATSGSNQHITYKFVTPICIKSVSFIPYIGRVKNYKVQASNDGFVNDIHDLTEVLLCGQSATRVDININNSNEYLYYRLFVVDTYESNVAIWTLQFLAWQPKGNVPIMTANNAPYGEASASSEYDTNFKAWKAFNANEKYGWASSNDSSANLTYKFTNPVCVKRVLVDRSTISNTTTVTITGSNDGTNYSEPLATVSFSVNERKTFELNNTEYYMYYRYTSTNNGSGNGIKVQYYGRELKVSVPKMTSNSVPWGEAFGTNPDSSYPAFKAFDGVSSTAYMTTSAVSSSNPARVYYNFKYPVVVKMISQCNYTDTRFNSIRFYLDASNDGEQWTTLSDTLSPSATTVSIWTNFGVNNASSYKYYRINVISGTYNSQTVVADLQFFGLDYSEHEERHWIYDHGVELEEVTVNARDGVATKQSSDILLKNNTSTTTNYPFAYVQKDTTDFALLRVGVGNEYYNNGNSLTMSVGNHSSSLTQYGYNRFASDALPHNNNYNISDINQNADVIVSIGNDANNKLSINEWWLE